MRFLLLQIRNPDDPMRQQEVQSFSRALGVPLQAISVFDLLGEALRPEDLEAADVFLLGGSGDYSAAVDAPWLDRALDDLRLLHEFRKPTFASCWGFQAMARAMGGRVVHDPNRAEIGTIELTLTDAGREDPLFGPLGSPFSGHAGHEDCVDELPPNATLLDGFVDDPQRIVERGVRQVLGHEFSQCVASTFGGRSRSGCDRSQRLCGASELAPFDRSSSPA